MGRKKEKFVPIKKGEVKLYSCGPTVYDYPHIGNLRAYIFVDVLRRLLEYNKLKVKHVMNITDVGHLTGDNLGDADVGEDKMEKGARREGKTVWEIAEFYTKEFFNDLEKLNIKKAHIICKATDHIKEMISMIKLIEKNGYAYKISDGIYFDTSKLKDYGKLAGLDVGGLREGARVEPNPEKRNPTDFALWKFSPKGQKRQMEWNSPWSVGFPGWHIECSAMSIKYLGNEFDIHTGGVDHISIHHTNEIAQSEGALGKSTVRFWLHNEHVLVDNKKMSKSLQNFHILKDITSKGYDPLAFRYLVLTTHYRSKLNFTWESLEASKKSLNTLKEHMLLLERSDKKKSNEKKIIEYKKKFLEYINDDLNISYAISLMWKLIREEDKINNKGKRKLIIDFDRVFGLRLGEMKKTKVKLPKEAEKLVKEREEARKKGDWERADRIREKLRQMGVLIEDTASGARKKLI